MKRKIARYQIIKKLGQGGMGVVYKAYDPSLKRVIAIKMLLDKLKNDAECRVRFEQEANTMAALRHPAIVPVHDLGKHHNLPYFVMPYMSGGSLAHHLRNGPLPWQQVETLLPHLAAALDKVHDHGLIHRDIKPANILFDENGRLYLADFGIARPIVPGTVTQYIGTVAYMAPEQITGQNLDRRSDVFQLGMVLFKMLTGELANRHDIQSVYDYNPHLPPGCDDVMARALARKKEDRYPTAGHLAADFSALFKGLQISTHHTGHSQRNSGHIGHSQRSTGHTGHSQRSSGHTGHSQRNTGHTGHSQISTHHTGHSQRNTGHTGHSQRSTGHTSESPTSTGHTAQSPTSTGHTAQPPTSTGHSAQKAISRSWAFWPLITTGILFLLVILTGFVLMFWPPEKPNTPIGLLISFTPPVDIKHGDSLKEAEVGLRLYEGDVVIAQANAGAVMSISCRENTLLVTLGALQNMPLDCNIAADENLIAELKPDVISREAPSVLTLPAQQVRSSRQSEAQTPVLLTPRNTLIVDRQPTFQWQGVPGASGYLLSLNIPNAENWQVETSDTTLPYPADKAPLPAGSRIFVKLATLDNPTEVEESFIHVMDDEKIAELAQREDEIRNLGVDDTAQAYLLAQLYRQQELNAAAIAQLEEIVAKGGAISADLWQQLGDLYFEIKLYAQAEEKYQQALRAAEANNDPQAQAFANFGLAQTAYVFNEDEKALEYLQQAERLSNQIGDDALAGAVAELKQQIEALTN